MNTLSGWRFKCPGIRELIRTDIPLFTFSQLIGLIMVGLFYLTPVSIVPQSYHLDTLTINPKGCIWYAGMKDLTKEIQDTSWSIRAKDNQGNPIPPQPILQSLSRSKASRIAIPPGMTYVSFHLIGNYYMTGDTNSALHKDVQSRDENAHVTNMSGGVVIPSSRILTGGYFDYIVPDSKPYSDDINFPDSIVHFPDFTRHGISGLDSVIWGCAVGVFLSSDYNPQGNPAITDTLDVFDRLTDYPLKLQQSFYVGESREFVPIPFGADSLYLGFALNRFDDPWSDDSLSTYLLFSADSSNYGLFPRINSLIESDDTLCYSHDTLYSFPLSSRSRNRPVYDTTSARQSLPDFLLWDGLIINPDQQNPTHAPEQTMERTDTLKLRFRNDGWRDTTFQGTVNLPYLQSTYKHLYYQDRVPITLSIIQPTLDTDWIDSVYYDTITIPFTIHQNGLVVQEKELDFGSVLVGEFSTRELTLINTCNEELTIDSLGFSDPQGAPGFKFAQPVGSPTISSKGTLRLPINFNPPDSGFWQDWLTIYNKTRQDTMIVHLFGVGGKRDISVQPESIYQDSMCYLDSIRTTLTIRNTGNFPLLVDSLSGISVTKQFQIVTSSLTFPLSIPAAGTAELTMILRLLTRPGKGPLLDSLILYSNAGNKAENYIPISLVTLEYPKPKLLTPEKDFGSVEVGNYSTFPDFLIMNVGCDQVRIDSTYFTQGKGNFIVETPDTTLKQPFPVKRYFAIRFQPLNDGLQYDTLILVYDSVSNKQDTLTLKGKGISPELSIDTTQLQIGDSLICNYMPIIDSFDITNTGTAGLRIYSIEISEEVPLSFKISDQKKDTSLFLTQFSDTLVFLTPGGIIKKFYLRYNPPEIGRDSAYLIVHTNHYYRPIDTFMIRTDSAKSQIIEVTHSQGLTDLDTLRFRQGGVGNRVDTSLTIYNPGCYELMIDRLMVQPPFYWDEDKLNRSLPLRISSEASLEIPLYFLPTDTSLHRERFRIYSDDPHRSLVTVPLQASSGYPVIGISRLSIMFDSVCIQNDSDSQSLDLKNTGSIPLSLDSVISRDPQLFRVESFTQDSILPGKSGVINLVYKPLTNPDSIKTYISSIQIWSNAPSTPPPIVVIGKSYGQQIDIISDTVEFVLQDLGVPSQASAQFGNQGCYPLILQSLQIDHPYFTYDFSLPAEIDTGTTISHIPLTFLPTGTQDTGKIIRADLRVTSNDPYQRQSTIFLQAKVGYALTSYSAEMLDFDSTCVFDSSTETLELTNSGIVDLIIDSLKWMDGSVFSYLPLTGRTLTPQTKINLTLKSKPIQIGNWPDSLIIYSNSVSSPDTISMVVPAKGQSFHLPITRIEFKPYSILSVNTQTVELHNSGCYPLEIDSLILLDTTNYRFISPFTVPFTIAPGGTYTSTPISYKPDSIEETATYLVITTNDPRHKKDSILMIGSVTREEFQRVKIYPLVCTPNKDGFNEQIDFKFLDDAYPESEILIFDKNGKRISHLTHYPFSWKGRTDEDQLVPPGVYLYFIKAPKVGIYQKGSVLVVY